MFVNAETQLTRGALWLVVRTGVLLMSLLGPVSLPKRVLHTALQKQPRRQTLSIEHRTLVEAGEFCQTQQTIKHGSQVGEQLNCEVGLRWKEFSLIKAWLWYCLCRDRLAVSTPPSPKPADCCWEKTKAETLSLESRCVSLCCCSACFVWYLKCWRLNSELCTG